MREKELNVNEFIKILEYAVAIMSEHGKHNYNRYDHGFANGIIFVLALAQGVENPPFLEVTQYIKDQEPLVDDECQ